MTEGRSSAWDRIDPEVVRGLDAYLAATGGGVNARATFAEQRELETALRLAGPPNPYDGQATIVDHVVNDAVSVRVYRPIGNDDVLPAVLDVHGGGMVRGSVLAEEPNACRMAILTPAVVVSVDYRLAPEHPYPAAIEDCYDALRWLEDQAAALNVDAGRIAVYGASAGGGLAAGLALLNRDRGGRPLALQALIYPMLDDRNETPSSRQVVDVGMWDRDANLAAWSAYLGARFGTDDVPVYAAPTRATDLRGLPPTYLDVGDVDMFRDEDVDYAQRLIAADVPVELHVYPGGIHATHIVAPDSDIAVRTTEYRLAALRRALHPRANAH